MTGSSCETVSVDGVRILGVGACLPETAVDNLSHCTALYGDAEKAENIIRATGVQSRRVLCPGETALDLCVRAADGLIAKAGAAKAEIGAVVFVTFTPDRQMPCNACVAAARLGLRSDIVAFDLNQACAGWLYGVYTASLLAKSLGRTVLLLDGDSQTAHVDPADAATVPLLADAGTATLLAPSADADSMTFAFLSDGAQGDALQLRAGGTIMMDGFAVFRFATVEVVHFIESFLKRLGRTAADFDAFVPHQANVYMIRQIAKHLGFVPEKLKVSGDKFGNSASATVPVTIAHTGARGVLLAAGFGGGLAAAVARLPLSSDCVLLVIDGRGSLPAVFAQ